ncbi:helix-turn-helix domain-containing protein [Haloarchaeobius sp. DYHT-AS-18]|uniref:helix-turn-helix domain-containing protein n=1 Tax=Haloarchaeobius sp. DYHT-AS-18 TaxID=3446117 RepID=UPI003EB6C5FE
MIPIVDITVPGDAFELGRLLEEVPGIRIELERIVPLQDTIIPLFWVSNGDQAEIEEILRDSALTEEVTYLTEDGKRKLFEVRWSRDVNGLIKALLDTRAKMLEGENIGEGWDFRLQFPSHDELSEFRRICDEQEVPIILRRLYNPHFPRDGNSMSTEQQEAILLAYERGYFDVPRNVNIDELAEVVGISDNAYSQRLRRGLSNLIYEAMVNH